MQASRHHSRPSMPNKRFCQPVRKFEAYSPQQCHPLNGYGYSIHFSQDWYCTLESSSVCPTVTYSSPSTVSFSPNESSLSHQESQSCLEETNYQTPVDGSGLAEDATDLKHKLKELEDAMLGPDIDYLDPQMNTLATSAHPYVIPQTMVPCPGGDLKQILIACAMSVSNNDLMTAGWLMSELRQVVSVSGEPMQRLGAYMLEGLVARVSESGSSIYKSLKLREPAGLELLSYTHALHEICPYFKFGYMSANGAIAEAMKDEDRVHIIDFQIGQGSQWIPLIQAFAARPAGPPHIRITALDGFTSTGNSRGLSIVGRRLLKLAEAVKVPFEYHTVAMSCGEVDRAGLGIRPGEAVAVNFAFVLHRTPDESVTTENRRDRLLRSVRALCPKMVTLVERELNTNTAAFYPRFREALDYYGATFESIDAAVPCRGHRGRIDVEQHCLAREVVNVIACEGAERVERDEPMGKWGSRLRMAGFGPGRMNGLVNATIKGLMEKSCGKYRVEERDGALYLGWLDRDLVASSAWIF